MTPEASEAIAEYYADLRNSSEVQALPVTVRTLETIIRLACAHAKVRLSPLVELKDVEEVQSIVDMILKSDPNAHERTEKASTRADNRTKRPRGEEEDDDEMSDESSEDDDDHNDDERQPLPRTAARQNKTGSKEDIKSVVIELGHLNRDTANVTRNVDVSVDLVREVLKELDDAEKIILEGDEFYLAS
jgi:DNA replicative helicase MCM subunit Mcm2 (Cdc46/Mcm family)